MFYIHIRVTWIVFLGLSAGLFRQRVNVKMIANYVLWIGSCMIMKAMHGEIHPAIPNLPSDKSEKNILSDATTVGLLDKPLKHCSHDTISLFYEIWPILFHFSLVTTSAHVTTAQFLVFCLQAVRQYHELPITFSSTCFTCKSFQICYTNLSIFALLLSVWICSLISHITSIKSLKLAHSHTHS